MGAAAVGTKLVFAPYNIDYLGVYDIATETFTTVATTGDAASGPNMYKGAVAVGTNVYFGPSYKMPSVGVYDTYTGIFSTIATTGHDASVSKIYNGVAAVGALLIFAPHDANQVGLLDTVSGIFSTVATGGHGNYGGAAAVGTKVVFAPMHESNGMRELLMPATSSFSFSTLVS